MRERRACSRARALVVPIHTHDSESMHFLHGVVFWFLSCAHLVECFSCDRYILDMMRFWYLLVHVDECGFLCLVQILRCAFWCVSRAQVLCVFMIGTFCASCRLVLAVWCDGVSSIV